MAFWEIRRSYHFGTAFVAVFLTVGLNSMQASAANLYPDIQNSIVSSAPAGIFDSESVVNYSLYEYAEYVPGPVDCSVEACIALTFDDGPNPVTTPQVLDALEGVHALATFFVIGSRVAANAGILQRISTDGDEVGNHSWSHPDFNKLTTEQMKEQVALTQSAIASVGLPPPHYFRPPYESRSQAVNQTVNMPFILWNVDPKDWAQKSVDTIVSNVVGSVKPGSMVVMHDTLGLTAQALPQILEKLKGHYHFVTVSQLLNIPADAKGEYFGSYLPQ